MILPYKTKNPPESLPAATIGLIALNILIYVFTSNGLEIREEVVKQFALTHTNLGPVTLLSSMFLHGSIFHILGNMWFLWLLGAAVEGRLKTFKFVLLYLVSGLVGDALHLAMTMNHPNIPSLGASGAIMGLMGAALWMFPHSRMKVFYWFGIFWHGTWEWRMWGVALYYLGFDIVDALLFSGLDGVAHFAHLGGALGGFLTALAFRANRDDVEVSDAKSELSDSSDLTSLTKFELEKLAKGQPESKEIALAWMVRGSDYGGYPSQECINHFLKHASALVKDGELDAFLHVLVNLSSKDGVVPAKILFDAGVRAEKEARAQIAISLLERSLKQPDCSDSIAESACFKLGQINESWFQNYSRALEWYEYTLKRWPMSSLEVQMKDRIRYLNGKLLSKS